jgi:hypothetical protein
VAGVAALALPLHHVETTSWAALARECGTDLAALALELKALAAVALAGIMLASRAAFARAWQLIKSTDFAVALARKLLTAFAAPTVLQKF